MSSVRCPECNAKVQLEEDYDRRSIRCTKCKFKIPLDQDDEDEDRPARLKKEKKKKRGGQAAPFLYLLPLLLVVPLVGCLALAPFHRAFGGGGSCFGLLACIVAVIMAYILAKREGLTTLDDMPWIVQRMPIVMIFFQFSWAFQRPLKIGPWVVVQIVGLVATIAGISISEGMNARQQNQAVDPGNKKLAQSDLDALLADLDSPDMGKSTQAAEKIAKIKPNERQPEVAKKLLAATNHQFLFTRKNALKALETWGAADQVPDLLALTNHKEMDVREGALEALGALKDPRGIQPLVAGLKAFGTRESARKGLISMGPPAEKQVLTLLADPDVGVQRTALLVLKEIGTQESVPALRQVAQGGDFFVRQPADEALQAINARMPK